MAPARPPARGRACLFFGAELLAIEWLLAGLVLTSAGLARADQEACLAAHERAQTERMRGHYVEAREQLITCAQASCPGLVRGDCKTWLQEVENSLPSLVFAVSDELGHDLVDSRVSTEAGLLSERSDGRALSINPGVYKLHIEAAGFAPAEQQLSVREGEKLRLVRVVLHATPAGVVALVAQGADPQGETHSPLPNERDEPAQDKRARRLMLSGYVLGGVGLASLITGITLGAVGKHKLSALQDCRPDCKDSAVKAGRRKYVAADIAFGASGALLGSALFSWLWGWRRKRDTQPAGSPALSLAVGKHGASFAWDAQF